MKAKIQKSVFFHPDRRNVSSFQTELANGNSFRSFNSVVLLTPCSINYSVLRAITSLALARTTKSHLTSRSDDLNIVIIDDDASQAFPTLRRSGTPLARLEIIGERGSPLDFPFSRSGLSRTHARFIPPPLGF